MFSGDKGMHVVELEVLDRRETRSTSDKEVRCGIVILSLSLLLSAQIIKNGVL